MSTILNNVRTHFPYYVFLLVLLSGTILVQGGVERNIWSLRYLQHTSAETKGNYVGFDTGALESANSRGHLWQAQDAFRAGNITLAEAKITPLIVNNSYDAPYLRRDTLRLYGAILAENGNLEQALSIWQDIEDIDSLQGFANKASREGNLTIALQAYEIAHGLDPQAGTNALANFLWRNLKEPGEAEVVLNNALNEFPYSGEQQKWLHLLGQVYRSEERWDDMVSIYEHLLRLDNSDASSALRLGYAKEGRGDGVASIMAQFQAAIEVDPNRGDGYYDIGRLLSSSGEFQMADQWFEQAIHRNPDAVTWHYAYAANARDQQNPELMKTRYQQIQAAFPENHRAQVEVAIAFYNLGLTGEAKVAIDTALRLVGSDAPGWYLEWAEKIHGQ